MKTLAFSLLFTLIIVAELPAQNWSIDSAEEWMQHIESYENAEIVEGFVSPKAKKGNGQDEASLL